MTVGGFYTYQQERNFHRAAELVKRGGPDAPVCGARTRTGGFCRALPIRGSVRCIKHCGPHAAKAYRERQREAFRAGKLSVEDWTRAEGRRAANRLRERWKKDPWVAGSTIDLGEHEAVFRKVSGLGLSPTADFMPPAVLDWLRWRYRRLQVDRRRDHEWACVLREELPVRLSAAGPGPDVPRSVPPLGGVHRWALEDAPTTPKRSRLDNPRAARAPTLPTRGRGRPRKLRMALSEDEEAARGEFIFVHRETLRPLFERCRDGEHVRLVEALRAFQAAPDDRTARETWMRFVMALQAR